MTENNPGIICVIYDEATFVRLQDQLDAARAENARLRKALKECPSCAQWSFSSPKVVAACERCGHRWEVE